MSISSVSGDLNASFPSKPPKEEKSIFISKAPPNENIENFSKQAIPNKEREDIQKYIKGSGCYEQKDNSFTLQQWLYFQFLQLMKDNSFSLSRFNWIKCISYCIEKKFNSQTRVKNLFGVVPKTLSLTKKVGALCLLGKKHEYFSTILAGLFGSSKKEDLQRTIKLHQEGIQAVASLYEESLRNLAQEVKKAHKVSSNNLNSDSEFGRPFVSLEKQVKAFKSLYRLRMRHIQKIFRKIPKENGREKDKKFLLLELASAITQFQRSMRCITNSLKNTIEELAELVPLTTGKKEEIRDSVNPLNQLNLISNKKEEELIDQKLEDIRKIYSTTLKYLKQNEILEEKAKNIEQTVATDHQYKEQVKMLLLNTSKLREKLEQLKKLRDLAERESKDLAERKLRDLAERESKDLVARKWESDLAPEIGGKEIFQAKGRKIYRNLVVIEQLLETCANSGFSIFRFAKEDLIRCSSNIKIDQETINNSWLQLFESEPMSAAKKKEVKTSQQRTKRTRRGTNRSVGKEQKEQEVEQEVRLEIPPKIWTKEKINLKELENRLDLLKKSSGQMFSFVSVIDWTSSLLPNSLPSLAGLDFRQKQQVNTAQKEASDHAFLSACGVQVFFDAFQNNDLLSALATVRTLMIHWHVQIEQTLFAEYTLKKNRVPEYHNLVNLARESEVWSACSKDDQALLNDLQLALLWARYPESYLAGHITPPIALQWLNRVNAWISSIQKGEKNQKLLQKIPELGKWISQTQTRVQNWLCNRLKQRKMDWTDQLEQTKDACKNVLEKRAKGAKRAPAKFPESKSEEQLSFAQEQGPYLIHLREVEGHLRHLSAVGQVPVQSHQIAWKEFALAQVQWAGEEAYRFVCFQQGIGQVLEHEFAIFQRYLVNQAQVEGKKPIVAHLDKYCFGLGAHYSRSRTFKGQFAYLKDLDKCRNSLVWGPPRKKQQSQPLPGRYHEIMTQGVGSILRFIKSVLKKKPFFNYRPSSIE